MYKHGAVVACFDVSELGQLLAGLNLAANTTNQDQPDTWEIAVCRDID